MPTITTYEIVISGTDESIDAAQVNALLEGLKKVFPEATIESRSSTAVSKTQLIQKLKNLVTEADNVNNTLYAIMSADRDRLEKGINDLEEDDSDENDLNAEYDVLVSDCDTSLEIEGALDNALSSIEDLSE